MVRASWLPTYAVAPSGLIRTCDGSSPTENGAESVVDGRSARTAAAPSPCVTYATLPDTATAKGMLESGSLSTTAAAGWVRPEGGVPTAGASQTDGGGGGGGGKPTPTKLTHPNSFAMTAVLPAASSAM